MTLCNDHESGTIRAAWQAALVCAGLTGDQGAAPCLEDACRSLARRLGDRDIARGLIVRAMREGIENPRSPIADAARLRRPQQLAMLQGAAIASAAGDDAAMRGVLPQWVAAIAAGADALDQAFARRDSLLRRDGPLATLRRIAS